ncbi:hypothetical protein ABW20_dc0104496 [Dactylellina cionopaga]|nr:hypothetical protein ABW20_dc0104496 [Dactylellina cionopaga]
MTFAPAPKTVTVTTTIKVAKNGLKEFTSTVTRTQRVPGPARFITKTIYTCTAEPTEDVQNDDPTDPGDELAEDPVEDPGDTPVDDPTDPGEEEEPETPTVTCPPSTTITIKPTCTIVSKKCGNGGCPVGMPAPAQSTYDCSCIGGKAVTATFFVGCKDWCGCTPFNPANNFTNWKPSGGKACPTKKAKPY